MVELYDTRTVSQSDKLEDFMRGLEMKNGIVPRTRALNLISNYATIEPSTPRLENKNRTKN